jgi:endonuclease G
MNRIVFALTIFLSGCFYETASAHPGGLNAEGCHNNRKTGEYHCHGESKPSVAKEVVTAVVTAVDAPALAKPEIVRNEGDLLRLDYEGFTLWLDCSKRGLVKYRFNVQRDTGNAKRNNDFYLDPNVPPECQQKSTKAYGRGYDRGHSGPNANALDYSELAIKQTNYMTNILPQVSQMNRGAMYFSEILVECHRDLSDLLIIGGVIWGDNPNDDYFLESHGVRTPDAFWKVVIRGTGEDERAIAWIFPNSAEATLKNADKYLVSIDEIERITGERIPVADYAKHDKPAVSWAMPIGCNKS